MVKQTATDSWAENYRVRNFSNDRDRFTKNGKSSIFANARARFHLIIQAADLKFSH